MEKRLQDLFDFQKFEGNADLRMVIESVHSLYAEQSGEDSVRELQLDDLAWIAAAGTPSQEKKEK